MKKFLKITLSIIVALYVVLCVALYFIQEILIFYPEKLPKNFTFQFPQKFEELNIPAKDGKLLNGLLFKAENSKGLIFYIHGNGGSLRNWGDVAKTYTANNYDVFILDFRGYGKSEGEILNENQMFQDNQTVYNYFKKQYSENEMVVLGYSIGTGMAAKLASENHPRLLILQAPYYNLTEMMTEKFSFIPTFILKYKFATNDYLKNCKMPVVIFHGTDDEVISFENSLKLKKEFKKGDTLIPLKDEFHNQITDNLDYQIALHKILNR